MSQRVSSPTTCCSRSRNPCSALNIKDPGNISAGARLDLRIGIGKLQLQVLSKVLANGGLAGPHGADKKNAVQCGHYVEATLVEQRISEDPRGDEDQGLSLGVVASTHCVNNAPT